MTNLKFAFILLLIATASKAQHVNFGASTALDIGGNSVLYLGGSTLVDGSITNEGTTIIEEDAVLNSTLNNSGVLEIRGDAVLNASSINNNSAGATWAIRGNSNIEGTVLNDGAFAVAGDLKSVINGSIDNNSDLLFEGNVDINGTVDNGKNLSILGDALVAGTLLNPDGSVTAIEGDLTLNTPFTNGGQFTVSGNSQLSNSLINSNEFVFLGSATFDGMITNNQEMYLGANTLFNSVLNNNGEILSFDDADINFLNNKELGVLTFSDRDELTTINEVVVLSSTDSVFIESLNLNTVGKVTLPSNFVLVRNELNIANGILNTTNQENFLVQGSINVDAPDNTSSSYIEGKMLAVTSANPTVFPMGINGNANFITLNSNTSGIMIKVECRLPNPDSLLTDKKTMGLAQEVEWTIESLSDSAEVQVSVDYSGVNFTQIPNFINAQEYDATLQRFGKEDSVFHALRTIESLSSNIGTDVPDNGTIKTANKIWLTTKTTRFALGLSPVLTEPVVYLPNVFTPGASFSENQVFRPFIGGAVISAVNFVIFDSFNKEVYAQSLAGEDIDLESIGWDGILNSGLEAPEGVYYYKVSVAYTISEDVSAKYFTANERAQIQNYSKLGSVMLVK